VVKSIQKLTQTEQLGMQVLNQAQSEIHSQYLDSSKAKNQLDWQARYTFEEGIQETLAWYSSYLSK
jgi:CDP-glucose 4,6-dehydratase